MTLDRDRFPDFFSAVHGTGRTPFRWQERLLDRVLGGASWPKAITVPTGAGKTAAIDVHVFALACAAAQELPLPPRRLAMVVARRVLVDDQYDHARYLRDLLIAPDDEVLGEVAQALWTLRDPTEDRREHDELVTGGSPLVTARLRGGEPPSRSWLDEPGAAAVICATPDMWGSRLLFRGYGAASRAWPRAAGLLAFDSAVVVDEAHLSSQLLVTARRVADLAEVTEYKALGVAPVQVVATTATPGEEGEDTVGVEDADLPDEPVLAPRLTLPKPVTLASSADWAVTTPRSRAVLDLSDAVVDLRARLPEPAGPGDARTVGCFVNTVARAVAVTAALRDRHGLRVVMICGQVRPHDLQPLRDSGLLGIDGDPAIDVLVSTQSLEVGVDLDLVGLVTELAVATALVQRAGRVNRRGTRETGPITVVVPTAEIKAGARSGPYAETELTAALSWVRDRAADPAGLSPVALRTGVPRAAPKRVLLQRPEWSDAVHWARTSDDLAADPELDLWLSEELDRRDELSLGLVVRRWIPADPADARAMLTALPPRRHEIFPLPFTLGRDAVARAYGEGYDATTGTPTLQAFRVRGKEIEQITWRRRENEPRPEGPERLRGWVLTNVRPGDVVVVDADTPLFTATGDTQTPSPPVVVPAGDETTRHRVEDVLEAQADVAAWTPGRAVHRIEMRPPRTAFGSDLEHEARLARLRTLGNALNEIDREDDAAPDLERAAVTRWLADEADPMARAVHDLLTSRPDAHIRVEPQRAGDDAITRVVVIDRRRAQADEDIRQVETPNPHGPPTLADHEHDVAARAREIGGRLGLDALLTDALDAAGAHHDKGKGDPRFQFSLAARSNDPPLAKERAMSARTRRRRREQSGLPSGWRHEQRSVVEAWSLVGDDVDRELVARLIGTSHGRGRTGFPHAAAQLLPDPPDDAVDLFDEGRWDELIERTHRRYGVWGCAYLEAVLRAADGQISREGR